VASGLRVQEGRAESIGEGKEDRGGAENLGRSGRI
jgi:hypothetical protein